MLRHRLMTAVAALVVGVTAMTGCSGGSGSSGSSGPVSLTFAFWGNNDRASKYQQAIDRFQKAHPDVTVKSSFAAWDDYWPQRATEAAGSSLPDVMQMDLAYLAQYGTKHHLLKLDPHLGKDLNVSGIDKNVLPAGRLDGATYAIPTGTNAFTLGYNPALLAKLGLTPPPENATWAQYQEWIKQVSAKGAGSSPAVYGAGDYTGTLWIFIHYLRQHGKQAFTADGKLGFTEQELADWWQSTAALRRGAVIPVKRVTALKPVSPMSKSEVAAEFFWDNQLAGYVADSGSTSTTFTLAKPPTDGGDSGLFYKASMLLSVAQNSKHPQQAAQLIDFLINDAEVGKIFGTSKGVPVTAPQRDAITATGTDAEVLAYEKSIQGVVGASQGALPEGFGTIEADFKRLGEEISYNRVPPKDAASQWYRSATQTLAG